MTLLHTAQMLTHHPRLCYVPPQFRRGDITDVTEYDSPAVAALTHAYPRVASRYVVSLPSELVETTYPRVGMLGNSVQYCLQARNLVHAFCFDSLPSSTGLNFSPTSDAYHLRCNIYISTVGALLVDEPITAVLLKVSQGMKLAQVQGAKTIT